MEPTNNDVHTDPDLLTISDAWVFLRKKVSKSLLYQWCDEQRLPHLRLGGEGRAGKILIHRVDIIRFLEANRVEQSPKSPVHLEHIQLPS